jgi:hypothetical protein
MSWLKRRRQALVDEVSESYQCWREAREGVRTAYRCWADCNSQERGLGFAGGRAVPHG